jgi:hypothetical protein
VRALIFTVFIGACACLHGAQAPVLYTDPSYPPAVLSELVRGQDLAMEMRFDEAEALIRKSMAEVPGHPLGGLFLMATLLSRTQEDFRRGKRVVPPALLTEVDAQIALALEQAKAFPESPYPKFYLGAAYGVRGLARLYAGSYISSYKDGKRGVASLREAVALKPDLYDAYMGLGQFEYYCATLGGVIQFLLALPGDADKGLAMLKECEEKATYAAWPCKAYRVKLIISDRKDFAAVEPELAALVAKYPGNYDFAQAVFSALNAGINTAALRRSGAEVLRRVQQGWSPPPEAKFNAQAATLTLAVAYQAASETAEAQSLLLRAAQGPDKGLSDRALRLLTPAPLTPAALPPSQAPTPLSATASPSPAPIEPKAVPRPTDGN